MTSEQRKTVINIVDNIEGMLTELDDSIISLSEVRDKSSIYEIGWVRENAYIHSIEMFKDKVINACSILQKSI